MTTSPRTRVIAIVGPTASGKTAISVELAEHFQGEIISADSRQVYKGLDVGTEKITPEEMRGVPHHLLSVAGPVETFSAADFKRLADVAIAQITARGHVPFVVGGTGFYIQALLDGLVMPEVPPNVKLRTELQEKSPAELYELLKGKDPDRAATIEAKNPRRLIRALEITEAFGKVPPLRSFPPYDVLYIGIETPDDVLRERITVRLESQIGRGLLEEVTNLLSTVPRERINEFGYEYRLTAEHLEGKLTLEELREKMVYELWHYAKRQRTWFRKDTRIHWFKREEEKNISDLIEGFLK